MSALWDASAVVPLCVPAQASTRSRSLLRIHSPVIWWGTFVEVRGALARLRRHQEISSAAFQASVDRLSDLIQSWREIQPTDLVRRIAAEQLDRFALRAGDALQLGAAMAWAKLKPRGRVFVCNDQRLSAAGRRPGLMSLPSRSRCIAGGVVIHVCPHRVFLAFTRTSRNKPLLRRRSAGRGRDTSRPAPPDPHVRIARMKCARTHFMRYVTAKFMWRPARNPFGIGGTTAWDAT
jgi:predicted nucleic acid-binding protein